MKVKKYTQIELDEAIKLHDAWCSRQPSGEQLIAGFDDLSGLWFKSANLRFAHLEGANLMDADLRYANLSFADLRGANLQGANLYSANLSYADLRDADLSGAFFGRSDLTETDLRGANLEGSDFSFASIVRTTCDGRIMAFSLGKHSAFYVSKTSTLRIGCRASTPKEWLKEYMDEGSHYDYSEEDIMTYGTIIKAINEIHDNLTKWKGKEDGNEL